MSHDLDTLRMVFGYHVVQQVVAADGTIEASEKAFLESHWPRQHLIDKGLLDTTGEPTESFHQACSAAVSQLRTLLDREQKLSLIDTFLQASLADGHLHHEESAAVVRAATLLEVPGSVWLARLEAQGLAGDVDLPDPDGIEGFLEVLDPSEAAPTETPADAPTASPDDSA